MFGLHEHQKAMDACFPFYPGYTIIRRMITCSQYQFFSSYCSILRYRYDSRRLSMTSSHPYTIHHAVPLLHRIREKGYTAVDMHIHTRYSDAAIGIPSLLSRARHLGTGIAVTDHNEIRGVVEASEKARDVLVVPGIELSSREGPHILLYFYSAD